MTKSVYSDRDYAEMEKQAKHWAWLAGERLKKINELEKELDNLKTKIHKIVVKP